MVPPQRIAGATPFDFLLFVRAPLLNHRMISPTELFVDGTFLPSASRQRTTLINPATEEPFAEIARADLSDVNNAIESAQRAWVSGWRDLAPGKRESVLHAVARKLREHVEEIAQLETLHIGKPISDARDEAALGARVFEYYAGAVTKFCGQTIPVGRGGLIYAGQPWVLACIVPWNFPFRLGAGKRAGAGGGELRRPQTSVMSPLPR